MVWDEKHRGEFTCDACGEIADPCVHRDGCHYCELCESVAQDMVEIEEMVGTSPIIEGLHEAIQSCQGSEETRGRNDRGRAYDGQPWTDHGLRGKQMVEGLTMRDIRDCFIKAFLQSHGECPEYDAVENDTWHEEMVYTVPGSVDPIAVAQNLTCQIEKTMGIFPNIDKDEGLHKTPIEPPPVTSRKFVAQMYRLPERQSCMTCRYLYEGPEGCKECFNPACYGPSEVEEEDGWVDHAYVDHTMICDRWEEK